MVFRYIAFVFILLPGILAAQKTTVKNLPNYNDHWLHFGFSLGINQANFKVTPVKNLSLRDTLLKVVPDPVMGFNLAIVSELRLHEFLTLRCLPALSFQDRILNYTVIVKNPQGIKDTTVFKKSVESTSIEFPIDLKFRSARLNNFAAYVQGGVKWAIDLASQEDVKNSQNPKDVLIKLKKNDFAYTAGFGLDFYFPYFKFSTEIKGAWVMRNLLVKEGDSFSSSIESLKSKLLLISLHFEG
jgi:hypothetical protein